MARGHQVVFFAIEGNIPAAEETRRSLEAIVESVAGVDKGSARVSVESAALCAAFDLARAPLAIMERALSRKLAVLGLSVAMVHVMDKRPGARNQGKDNKREQRKIVLASLLPFNFNP